MKARIFGKTGLLEGFEVGFEGRLEIGRDAGNAASIQLASVSSRHAVIEWDDERAAFYVRDLESRNGTRVDGVRVTGRERLGRLSILTLAEEHDLVFQNLSDCEERALSAELEPVVIPLVTRAPRSPSGAVASARPGRVDRPPRPAQRKPAALDSKATVIGDAPPPPVASGPPPVAPARGGAPRASLEIAADRDSRVVALQQGENVIGRVPGAHIRLDSGTVSRRHAVVTVRGEVVSIRDEGSRNKTLVDGEILQPGVETEVHPGAVLRFGTVDTRLRIDP